MEIYFNNNEARTIKPKIYIYSQPDIDHSLRCCRLDIKEETSHPLSTELENIFSKLKGFTKHTIDKFEGIFYKGLQIEFEDPSKTWDSDIILIKFNRYSQQDAFSRANNVEWKQKLSYSHGVKGTNILIKEQISDYKILVDVRISEKEIY